MKKHKRKASKVKEDDPWVYAYIFLIGILVFVFLVSTENEPSKEANQESVEVVEPETPEQAEPLEELPEELVEEPIEELLEEPMEEPIVSGETEEVPIEPVPEEVEQVQTEPSDDELALKECIDLCIGGGVENAFKQRECSATCTAVLEHSGRDALDTLINGLKK